MKGRVFYSPACSNTWKQVLSCNLRQRAAPCIQKILSATNLRATWRTAAQSHDTAATEVDQRRLFDPTESFDDICFHARVLALDADVTFLGTTAHCGGRRSRPIRRLLRRRSPPPCGGASGVEKKENSYCRLDRARARHGRWLQLGAVPPPAVPIGRQRTHLRQHLQRCQPAQPPRLDDLPRPVSSQAQPGATKGAPGAPGELHPHGTDPRPGGVQE